MTTQTRLAGRIAAGIIMLLCAAWLAAAVWIQDALGAIFTPLAVIVWLLFAARTLILYMRPSAPLPSKRNGWRAFALIWLAGLLWFLALPPQQNRTWAADVARQVSYQQHGNKVTLHNVRNFDWHSETDFVPHWETRTVDLNHLSGVNVIASYWMGPHVAHTLVSFDFDNAAPLVFSIEIRKEQGESFSAVGGFFRQFELSLIAADERDIVYTRSNVRGEQVYFFPIQGLSRAEMRALFEAYLREADDLAAKPRWYNTLTSNCTTLVYDLAQTATHGKLPLDYRLLASGYLPNYLHDIGALNPAADMQTWYNAAHVNPKTVGKTLSSAEYSALMRQGLPR